MIRRLLAVALSLLATPALAQSTYVAGAIGADVVRLSHADSSFYPSPAADSEVLIGALRVGTSITPTVGVELEFVRSGRTNDAGGIYGPILAAVEAQLPGVIPGLSAPSRALPVAYNPDIQRRQESFDALVWARQAIGGGVDLVYLGGLAFTRDRSVMTYQVNTFSRTIAPPTPIRNTYIEYGAHPLVGLDARIAMTSRLRLIPGIRVQGLTDGWVVRPSVALGWFF